MAFATSFVTAAHVVDDVEMFDEDVTNATFHVSVSMSKVPSRSFVRAPFGSVHVPALTVQPTFFASLYLRL